MAGWLSRATEGFRKPPPPAPELYEVGCDCGGRVTGERSRQVQRPPCPSCGRLIFVLPANVYPRSVKPAPKKTAPPSKAVKPTDAEETKSKSPAKVRTTVEEPEAVPRDPRSGIALEANEKWLTPFRLTLMAMLAVSGLTIWGLWQRHQVELAKTIVAKATEAGMQALQDGDFETAARELERARDAVNLLRRTDEESQSVRRLCREAVAARGLAQASLFELLPTLLADLKPGDKDAQKFDGLSRNNWILFDVTVLVPEDDAQPCTLDMPVLPRLRPIRIEVDFAALRQAARQSPANEPVRVIFAAQWERIASPAGANTEAVLTLNGQSAFLWTSYDNYAALGYREENVEEQQATHAVLDRQLAVVKELK